MALMVLMLLVSPSHCTLHTKKLPDNQTIYFDKISNMKLIRDEWKLVVFYDMTAYWEGVSLATKYIDHLDNCCQKIQNISHCQLVLLHLRHSNGILMNLKDIQQMLLNTITDIFHGDNLIFEIKLPLVGRDTFEVYKLTPIPIAIGDKMRQIIIASDLLAINYQKDLQIPLSSLQLQQCIHYDMDILLCAHQIPISITKTEPNYCAKEIESLSCKTESRKCKNTWVQLHKVNNYLYSCCGQCTVQVICDDQITIERLDKVGILALASGCVIKDDGITLLSRRQSSNDLKLKPDIINIDIPTINNIVNVTMPLHVSEIDTNHTDIRWELKMIGDKIDQVKNNTKTDLEDETSFNYHDIHHYIAIYVLAGAILLTCLAYGVRKIRARVLWRAEATLPPPQPQPRTRRVTDHQYHSENNQCFSVSDEYNRVNNHPSTSDHATDHVYARVNKVKFPNSFSFSVVE
ncbi:hypothetical protein SFRURICE_018483 [Spodoptera frugiperda]|nr:hypothetical protein SFRURICE_018483 [Spodoptera frugiperda]